MSGRRTYRWGYPFFGLTNEYRINVYEQIDALVSNGYSFHDVYTMPVYLRNFFIRLSVKKQEEEKRAMDKSRGFSEGTPVSRKEMSKVPGFVAKQVSVK